MNPIHRLHNLRMENDQARYAMEEQRERFDRLAVRHEAGTAPRAVSAFNLFQTPPEVAKRMAEALRLTGGPILEPSAGLGRLLDVVDPIPTTAIEIAPQLVQELYKQERDGVKLLQRDFLTVTPEETGLFEAVIMNPPFHMRADIKHIKHALTFLRPGGRLAALCMAGPHREKELKPLAETWEILPAKTFKETGTNIDVVFLTIQI